MIKTPLNVLILAGGKNKQSLQKMTGQKYKAFIRPFLMHSANLLENTINVLQKVNSIRHIYLAAPKEVQQKINHEGLTGLPAGNSLMETIQLISTYLLKEPYILISTCDLPLIEPQHIEKFITDCMKMPGFDIYYAIIDKKSYTQAFPSPNLKRIYGNLVEGSFTGGNLFLLNPKVIKDCADSIEPFIVFRKHPLKMAQILGQRFVVKYLRGYLSIRDLEKMVPDYLKGYTGKAVLADPEIAFDIDKPIQLNTLLKMMNK